MHPIVQEARQSGQLALTDWQTKQLLRPYGIPLAQEAVAYSPEEAAMLARQISGPVALKILSPDILHKSDVGGVRVGVEGETAVRVAYDEMVSAVQARLPQARIEGVLVQELIRDGIELIAGIAPDPAFGRLVMFGLGGILVEILKDVSFRVAPLSRDDALSMIRELKGLPILQGARGRTPVSLDALADILLCLSRVAEELGDDLAELDINPLIARPDGALVAVDTRAALTPMIAAAPRRPTPPLRPEVLNRLFAPKSLAIIGASNSPDKIGYLFMEDLLRRGYAGQLYPVNLRSPAILGLPAYRNINDIPGPVDLAIVAVPPQAVLQVLRDCAHKGVPGVMVNTAGFSETGTEAGRQLEREMLEIADAVGMRVIGPNGLGIYNPTAHLGYLNAPELPGRVAAISQSGSMTVRIVKFGVEHGIGFGKAVSSGNESDLTVTDYIEYFGQDPQTEIIVAYVEGIKDGQRFLRVARKVARRKPILIWKAGRTEAGAQAASSHTGALASGVHAYNAAFAQAGVLAVGSFTALLDGLLLLDKVGPQAARQLTGRGIAIISGPGGMGVALADACNDLGLSVPVLSVETQARLREILPGFAGTRNPVDITMAQIVNQALSRQCLRIVDEDPGIEALVTVVSGGEPMMLAEVVLRAKAEVHKPLLALINDPPEETKAAKVALEQAGIPVYEHPERVAQALAVVARKPSILPQ